MSFDIALSGIQAINQQLETVSNNIANAGAPVSASSAAKGAVKTDNIAAALNKPA